METVAMTPVNIRLEEMRTARGLSQAELARRSGVPQPTISRIEAGKTRSIDLDNLEALANALGVNAAVLIDHSSAEPARETKKKRAR